MLRHRAQEHNSSANKAASSDMANNCLDCIFHHAVDSTIEPKLHKSRHQGRHHISTVCATAHHANMLLYHKASAGHHGSKNFTKIVVIRHSGGRFEFQFPPEEVFAKELSGDVSLHVPKRPHRIVAEARLYEKKPIPTKTKESIRTTTVEL